MRRRDFITVLGGAAFTGPFAVSAQPTDRMRRVGVLMGYGEGDFEAKAFLAEFTQGLSALGWIEGRNLRMDVRWAPGSKIGCARSRRRWSAAARRALGTVDVGDRCAQWETRTIQLYLRPSPTRLVPAWLRAYHLGGNITGFGSVEASFASKWLELLMEIAPDLKRATMIFNPDRAPYVESISRPYSRPLPDR